MTKKVVLDEMGLSLGDLLKIVYEDYELTLSKTVKKKIQRAREVILKVIKSGENVYGINTGFGALRDCNISEKDAEQLQMNLIRSHSSGVGKAAPVEYVKAMMVLRVSAIAQGYSGCTLNLLENLIQMINKNVIPVVPIQGSVGASGDLAPLSHMALALIGEGEKNVNYQGEILDAKDALKRAKIPITTLSYKEGLALNNGTQFSTGIACIVIN
ncbi:aromatic amino acid lyase, partial [Candidatus Heimdallarchaeota archaeon]